MDGAAVVTGSSRIGAAAMELFGEARPGRPRQGGRPPPPGGPRAAGCRAFTVLGGSPSSAC